MRLTNKAESRGKQAEALAAYFLTRQGLRIIASNFRCRLGELDLIAIDADCLVFIEVRYRQNNQMMDVSETLTADKQRKLIKASQFFLSNHRQYHHHNCRYDFIGVTGELDNPDIEWIKNAFQA